MFSWKKLSKKKRGSEQTRTADLSVIQTKVNGIAAEPTRMTSIPDMSLWDSHLIAHIVPDYECCHPDCPIATESTSEHEPGEAPVEQQRVRIHRRKFLSQGYDPTDTRFSEGKPRWYDISDTVELLELPDTKAHIVSVERVDSEIVATHVRVWTSRGTGYNESAKKWSTEIRETVIRLQLGESLLVVDAGDNRLGVYFEQEAFLFTLCGK